MEIRLHSYHYASIEWKGFFLKNWIQPSQCLNSYDREAQEDRFAVLINQKQVCDNLQTFFEQEQLFFLGLSS